MRNWTARRVGNSYGRSGGVVVSAAICGVDGGGGGGGVGGGGGGYRRRVDTVDARKTVALSPRETTTTLRAGRTDHMTPHV